MADNIKAVKVRDPNVATDQATPYAVLEGASEVTWQQIPANNVSVNSISINAPSPSGMLIDRRVYLQCVVQIVFNGT